MTPTQATATPAPCPFCNTELVLYKPRHGSDYYQHQRNECLLSVTGMGDPIIVFDDVAHIAAWNRRSSVPTPMSDSNDAIKADWDRVMSGLAPMSDSTVAAPEVTDAMVDAYLKANDAYWKRTDELPTSAKNPGRWREGTPREATRESLRAALGVDSTVAAGGATYRDAVIGALEDGDADAETQKHAAAWLRASLSATPADIRGLARAELRQTRVPAPAVAAITERQDSVHPASDDRTVPTAIPFSEPSACESSELPVRPTNGQLQNKPAEER